MFLEGNLEELSRYLIRSQYTVSTQSLMIEGLYNRWLEDRSQPDSLGTEENLIFKFMYVSDYQDPALNPPPEELLVWHLKFLPNIWSWTIFKKRIFLPENQGYSPFQVKNWNNLYHSQGFSLVVDPLYQSSWKRNAEILNRLKGVSSPHLPSSPSSQWGWRFEGGWL